MTLCTEILTIVNNLENVHATREDVPYDAVERLVIRLGPRLFRLTLITADVCTCYVDNGSLRQSFQTAHEFANFMQINGATLAGSVDGMSSDIGSVSDSDLSSEDTDDSPIAGPGA